MLVVTTPVLRVIVRVSVECAAGDGGKSEETILPPTVVWVAAPRTVSAPRTSVPLRIVMIMLPCVVLPSVFTYNGSNVRLFVIDNVTWPCSTAAETTLLGSAAALFAVSVNAGLMAFVPFSGMQAVQPDVGVASTCEMFTLEMLTVKPMLSGGFVAGVL